MEPEDLEEAAKTSKERILVVALRILAVVGILGVVALGGWALAQVLFQPRLAVVGPQLPEVPPPAYTSFDVGAVVRNGGLGRGSALVVAVLSNGSEVQGPVMDIPPLDTATVSVELVLGPGDHVLTLVVFSPDEEGPLERLGAIHGLGVVVGTLSIEVTEATLEPDSVGRGDSITASVAVLNSGDRDSWVVPIAVFLSRARGRTFEFGSQLDEFLMPGDDASFQFTIDSSNLEPGDYRVWLMVLTPDGQRLARADDRLPVVVTETEDVR